MASFLSGKRDDEIFNGCYRDFFASTQLFTLDSKTQMQFSIRAFLEPLIYQRLLEGISIPTAMPEVDTICRSATWEALYTDEPVPSIEENAVEKYAGSLDSYLPDDIPIEAILNHSKG